jgi:hypothetical protein
MAKAPEKILQRAVDREMPGYTVRKKRKTSRDQADSARKTDAVSPDLESLKKKYLGGASAADAADSHAPTESGAAPRYDDEIVPVEPKDRTRDGRLPGGSRAKRVVYSGASDKIIGRQG